MESTAKKIFSIFEKKIPENYETEVIRTSQVQMAMDIAAFLNSNESRKIMFIEAPVGTGKSLGALIPSMIEAKKRAKDQVVYATATINLQSQLMNSEVPLLKKLLLVKQPILAKGKTHYFCKKEFMAKRNQFTPKEQEGFFKFVNRAKTGQRNEFEDVFKQDISEYKWSKVALNSTKRECERCEFSLNCPSIEHRNNFMSKSNDLVITNHGQLIQSVLNSTAEIKQSAMVPISPGIMIIDEAHHFIENFLNQLEQSFTLYKLREMKKFISNKYKKKYVKLLGSLERNINKQWSSMEGSLQGRYPLKKDIRSILKELQDIVNNSLIEDSARHSNQFSFMNEDDYGSSDLEELYNALKNILDDSYVSWINYDEKKFSLISESFPTDFRKFMDYLKQYNKIIVMSGTLTTNGDFDSLLNQWRLNKSEVITKRLDTTFDYPNQTLVYVPENMVLPTNPNYLENCVENIKGLISLTEGRSLILTTAKEHMNTISENLIAFLKEKKINLFVQNQIGVEKLTKQFKEDETSVLVGSGSFFSGFSVPGKSLISVVLTKLPFPVPNDPFLELIGQGYEDELFELIIFPHMMNKLNQAAGRLIRDIKDFGIFTILDPRIFTQKYSGEIQDDLESQGYKITRSLEEVKRFIDKKLKNGAEAQYHPYKREKIYVKDYLWETPVIQTKAVGKTSGMVQKVKNVNNNEVTESQIEFSEEICKQYDIRPPTPKFKKTPDVLYKYLIESLFWKYDDTAIVENEFPFSDETEKKRLSKIKGIDRMPVTLPNCSKFGCDGVCKEKTKQKICEMLKADYKANKVKFYNGSNFTNCTVSIEPIGIIVKHFNDTK